MVPEKTIFTIADEDRIIKKDALPKSAASFFDH
jgi:hypothetical protein